MVGALITLFIYLLVLGLLYWLVIYVLDSVPIPDPPNRIIKIALMVLMVIIVIVLLLNLIGVGIGNDIHLPRLGG
jgi:hypothetical protein